LSIVYTIILVFFQFIVEMCLVLGAHQSIRESSFRSAGVQNIVETATDTLLDMGVVCNQVDDIINEFQTQYNQQVSENEASLRRVNHTFNALNINLTHINHAVSSQAL